MPDRSARPTPPSPEVLDSITRTLDALQCGASVVDRSGTIVFMNRRFCELIGQQRADLIGKRVSDLYTDPAVQQRIERMLDRFDEAVESEFYVEHVDGRQIAVVSAARPLRDDESCIDLRVVTITDISKLKAMTDEMHKLNDMVIEQAIELKHHNEQLETRVRERTAELHEANMSAIYMLAVASEARDTDTGAHVKRIEAYASAVAGEIGLDPKQAERIGYSAILHDVGKIQTPDAILKKPGRLTDEERAQMQQHTIAGEAILSTSEFFLIARQIARSHHENWDGSGYPDGLAGEAIPLAARIVHVVDVYDALVNKRVYKEAWPVEKVLAAIRQGAGSDFDPQAAGAFIRLHERGAIQSVVA
jgi:PAS domain S-box-containing protein/putative nucleotidyltransferase with HDIG domain